MPDEQPTFTSTPIADENVSPAKKRVRRSSPKPKMAAKKPSPMLKKEIDDTLTTIYEDSRGAMPDMKKIELRPSHPILTALSKLVFSTAIVAAAVWVGWWYFFSSSTGADTAVTIAVDGPDQTTLGATSTYTISYQNNGAVDLHNIVLDVQTPSGFIIEDTSLPASNEKKNEWALGSLSAHKSGSLSISGHQWAEPNTDSSWRVFFNYQPANFNSVLQKISTLTIKSGDSPVTPTITGPSQASVGSEVAYTITVANNKGWLPASVEITPSVPSNFSITSSTPPLVTGNKWLVNLTPSSTYPTVVFRGKFSDDSSVSSTIGATLALRMPGLDSPTVLGTASTNTSLLKNNIALNLAINGTMTDFDSQPGDTLNCTLQITNNSAKDIKNIALSLGVDAPAIKKQSFINWANIADPADGDIVGQQLSDTLRRGTITWKSKQVPDLARLKPGSATTLDLKIPFKQLKDFDLGSLTSSTVSVTLSATYTDATGAVQTVALKPIIVSINSDVAFESQVAAAGSADATKQTKITWVFSNSLHPLKDVDISADVFGDVSVSVGNPTLTASTAEYDSKAQKITWHITNLPTSVDVATLPFSITLNKQNPTQNMLVSKVHISGTDATTGRTFDLLGDEVPLTTN